MVREHHVAMLPTNHISVFCMELCISDGSHIKYTYMIGREHNHVVLPDYASISPTRVEQNTIVLNTKEKDKSTLQLKQESLKKKPHQKLTPH